MGSPGDLLGLHPVMTPLGNLWCSGNPLPGQIEAPSKDCTARHVCDATDSQRMSAGSMLGRNTEATSRNCTRFPWAACLETTVHC